MSNDSILAELLLRWDDLVEQGETPSAEALCRDHPELAPELARRIEIMQRWQQARDGLDSTRRPEANTAKGEPQPLPRIPGYEIQCKLGQGGMGVVFRARDERLGRVVALKLVRAGAMADESDRHRLLEEARAVAAVKHPGIVAVYECGTHEGLPFIALEFCEGGSLAEYMNGTPLPPSEAARVVAEVASAVQAAHTAGVLHRDLKPANVLLSRSEGVPPALRVTGGPPVPRVSDFGLARRLDTGGEVTPSGQGIGTLCYTSPEQAQGKKIGAATDIYGLGAILYECLTGRPPFQAATIHDTLSQLIHDPPVAPRALNRSVPRDLETICLKCLEKSPERRYRSAGDIAGDLNRFLRGEPIHARPAGFAERTIKWARRRPALAGLAATVFVAVLGIAFAGGFAFVQWRAERQVRRDLQEEQFKSDSLSERRRRMSEFYEKHLLAGARPKGEGIDREVTLKEALDKAKEKLSEAFADRPEDEAAVSHVLAGTYFSLGEYDVAEKLQRRALDLRREHLGDEHFDTQSTWSALGITLLDQNKLAEAEKVYEGLIPAMSRSRGEEDRETLVLMNNLALVRDSQGKSAQTIPVWKSLLETRIRILGEEHHDCTATRHNLSMALIRAGHAADAEPILKENYAHFVKAGGPDHPHTLLNRNVLAIALTQQKKYAEAETILRDTLPRQRKVIGPTHRDTLRTWHNLAFALLGQGRNADAETEFREVLLVQRKALGEDYPDTKVTRQRLKAAREAQGKPGEDDGK